MTEAGALADSRAVLIGVSAYEYAEFPPIRAARNSLQAMYDLLADPALCAWPPGRITVIPNPIFAADLAARVADLAESTTGVLLLYYVGHGVLGASGELCLTVTSTRPDRPKISGLPWDTLADVLRICPARVRLVILDCCFAGQAIEALSADGAPGFADIAHVKGVYTLTATTRNRTAHVPPADQQDTACTSFTGELRDLIRSGIPGGPSQLTFDDIYPVLRQRLQASGLPAPFQRGTDTVTQFPFTANAAVHVLRDGGNGAIPVTQTALTPVRIDHLRAIHLLGDAERAAHLISSQGSRASTLATVATALAAADPDRAERVAQSITVKRTRASALATSTTDREAMGSDLRTSILVKRTRASALAAVAAALAATAPDRAERVAQSITDESSRAQALADLAMTLAATDPDRAERVAQSIIVRRTRASALAAVAAALAATDPDRAERVAQSIIVRRTRASALAAVAAALAATDPDRAERVARSITSRWWMPHKRLRVRALVDVAAALAASDPERAARLIADAVRVAESITFDWWRARALADIATALAASDPDRAERVAQSITNRWWMPHKRLRVRALVDVAAALAASDPERAARLIAHAERIAESITDESSKAPALVDVAAALAASDPDLAERVARSITDESSRARALADLAMTLAATDPDLAERVARSITDESSRARALADLAMTLAATDPDLAERVARSITDESSRARALADVANVLAAREPNRATSLIAHAEHVARSITDESLRASTLATVATALAATDPDRAERVAQSITDKESQALALVGIAKIGLQNL